MSISEQCQEDARRRDVRASVGLNGLDFAEVEDTQLTITFLGKAPLQITDGATQFFRITGGRRIRDIRVMDVRVTRENDPNLDDRVVLTLDKRGDFSSYSVHLIRVDGIDPMYDHAEFSFRIDCPTDLDCATPPLCSPPERREPDLNYLAKDYASFRQLILDRLAFIMPEWREGHIPDLGITLVELLAYVGDYLSYYQDAVGTEAYLQTARQRISVRRHARLVDYRLHEGCNARAWLCLSVAVEHASLNPCDVYFITSAEGKDVGSATVLDPGAIRNVDSQSYEAFEAVGGQTIELYQSHNNIAIYSWDDENCCIEKGSTSATLIDRDVAPEAGIAATPPQRILHLRPGDVIVFEEVLGPDTGDSADADPTHRHAVRLTSVAPGIDPLNSMPVLEVAWGAEDALPFSLCLSSRSDPAHGCRRVDNVTVVRGNTILIDHGLTVEPCENIGSVPIASQERECLCDGRLSDVISRPGRFRPRLANFPITFREENAREDPSKGNLRSAISLLNQDVRLAMPQAFLMSALQMTDPAVVPRRILQDLTESGGKSPSLDVCCKCCFLLPSALLVEYSHELELRDALVKSMEADPENASLLEDHKKTLLRIEVLKRTMMEGLETGNAGWHAVPDLIGSSSDDRGFVVEIDNDGIAWVRFGDDDCGRLPEAASTFYACYRVGNGLPGNVGAESISRIVVRHGPVTDTIISVRNPLPAVGGREQESIQEAKLYAPYEFRRRRGRAIVADDYARIAEEDVRVQRAGAELSWTGSWYEVRVGIDEMGTEVAEQSLLDAVERFLSCNRRVGHDLRVVTAELVPLDIGLMVCVEPHYLRGHVKAALLELFSSGYQSTGRPGFFHPDNLSLGESISLSRLVAVAQGVQGVAMVEVTKLERMYQGPNGEIDRGFLAMGPHEVARVDNDPSYPENGRIILDVQGGR